jgi:hypothetical protein
MGKTKDFSKDCNNIVLNLFKFFQLEKARGRPLYSPVRLLTQRSKSSRVFFLSFGLLDSGGLLPFTTQYTELQDMPAALHVLLIKLSGE